MTGVNDDMPGIVANDLFFERMECKGFLFFCFNFGSFNKTEPSPRLATSCICWCFFFLRLFPDDRRKRECVSKTFIHQISLPCSSCGLSLAQGCADAAVEEGNICHVLT